RSRGWSRPLRSAPAGGSASSCLARYPASRNRSRKRPATIHPAVLGSSRPAPAGTIVGGGPQDAAWFGCEFAVMGPGGEMWLDDAQVAAEVHALRPDYAALLIVADGLRPGPSDAASDAVLAAAEDRARKHLGDSRPEELPEVAEWRGAVPAARAQPPRAQRGAQGPRAARGSDPPPPPRPTPT